MIVLLSLFYCRVYCRSGRKVYFTVLQVFSKLPKRWRLSQIAHEALVL